MKVAVFGLGYVGTVTAAGLASVGHDVVGVDVDPVKVDLITAGRSPVVEPGIFELLADAVALAQSNGIAVEVAIDTVTKEAGRRLGRDMKQRMGGGQTAESAHRATIEVLSEQGFEPDEHEDGTIELSNCPFHALAEQQTELICGMNHCLIDTALTELDAGDLQARLQPDPNACCVRLYRT